MTMTYSKRSSFCRNQGITENKARNSLKYDKSAFTNLMVFNAQQVQLSQGDGQAAPVRLIRHNHLHPPPPPLSLSCATSEPKHLGLTEDGETTSERKKETTARFNHTEIDKNES